MDITIKGLKDAFLRADTSVRLIWVNAVLFILVSLVKVTLLLFNVPTDAFLSLFYLPSGVDTLLSQPWSIITYMFLHEGLLHLLLNMAWLWWIGKMFTSLFCQRHLLGLYIMGGILGGAFYMLCYHIFPYFSDRIQDSFVVGSSASVLAIVVASAFKAPSWRIHLAFLGSIKLLHIAIAIVILDLLMLTDGNSGGHLAHLGGALTGFLFTWLLEKGHDITDWINFLITAPLKIQESFQKKPFSVHEPSSKKDQPFQKTEQKKQQKQDEEKNQEIPQDDDMELILKKVRTGGYHSLTEEEKKKLFYGKR